ncbi:hypothetical protein NB311A_01994 [Nitrobacter sp. Nb-311A]|nr:MULTISPECIES: hypothetical protein [unclassified Nitrobacter]EAQ36237.1 hypothetical protein NB311A_01994 [Nitrobacter sp. Nb-311A]MCB1394247.1 hypothetical protein [Nitrobacter sp.]MCV0387299.1 hypothetical protein [Nitrobacter sp.]
MGDEQPAARSNARDQLSDVNDSRLSRVSLPSLFRKMMVHMVVFVGIRSP